MKYVALVAALLLCFAAPRQQPNSQEPDLTSKRVAAVVFNYSKENRLGEILFSDEQDKIDHWIDVWGKSVKDYSPIIVTYVFEKRDDKGRRFYTATFGKGPVERDAFNSPCLANVPDFKDDVYWSAQVVNGKVQFEPLEESALKEGVIKVLFRSVKGTIQRWLFENARPVISQSPYDDQRILTDLVNREANRRLWYSKGWLRPENRCVRYLANK
jgi:hypothetical protein